MTESKDTQWPEWLPLRDDLKSLSPYGAPQIEQVLHMNTNENPFDLPESVSEAISAAVEQVVTHLNRYPDRDAMQLRAKLAGYINGQSDTKFDVANIWAANGSNEVLQTILLAFGGNGHTVLGFTPSYSVHPLISKITGTTWVQGNRRGDFSLDISHAVENLREVQPELVFVTTPNNPSGNAIAFADLHLLAEAAQSTGSLLIVDEAYQEFSKEASTVKLIAEFPNAVVVRTMSKAFAFAGARLGYLVAHPKVVEAMLITRLPYHLSSLTQAVAQVALDHHVDLQREVDFLIAERDRLAQQMKSLGLSVIESSANFLLFTGFAQSSQELWQSFLDRGVLIRDVGLPGYLRVTVGTRDENERFFSVLQELAS